MTAYTSQFNTPPNGTNFLIDDTVTLSNGDVWKYAGKGMWAATAANVVTLKTDPITGVSAFLANGIDVTPLTTRTTPLRIATFGDSTANTGSSVHDTQNLSMPFPGSGSTQNQISLTAFALSAYYPKAYLVGNGGIAGTATATMLARDTLGASSTRKAITDILNLAPDVIFYRGGSINDLNSVSLANIAATVAATYANHVQIINRLRSGGAVVIDTGIYAYSALTYPDPATTRLALQQLNALYAAYAAGKKGLYFINYDGILRNSDGNYLPKMSGDGVHPDGLGSLVVAATEAKLLAHIFGPSYGPRYGGQNIVVDPMMTATTTGGIGTTWNTISVTASNLTRQNALVEVINDKIYQTCEAVPTAGTNSIQLVVNTDNLTSSIAANDVYGCEIDIYIKNISASVISTLSVYARMRFAKTAAGSLYFEANTSGNYILSPGGEVFAKLVVAGPFTIQEAAEALASSAFAVVFSETETLNYKVGIAAPRIVKLGQPVLTS